MIALLERVLEKIPFLNRYYIRRAARLKRGYCLLLHRFGLLRPISFVQWLTTYRCNFHCPYCEASAGEARENELTTEEAKGLIDDLAKMGARRLLLSGGEPLVRPDLIQLMEYACGRKLQLGLVTNGYRVEVMWDALRQFRYFLYFTSIDGIPEYNDRIRGKEKAFEKAMKGLELFKTLGVRTRMINTVVHPGNIDQLESMLRIFKDSAATRWHLTPAASVGRAADSSKYHLGGRQLRYLVEFIKRNRDGMSLDLGASHAYLGWFDGAPVGKPFFCGAGLTRCAIMPDGEVLGCQQIYDNTYSEGNIRKKPFSAIWKEGFARFRKKQFPGTCSGCPCLDACQGGCWAEMELHGACLKSVWEEDD
jgi:radical SAM protein with 4Fe4S-binding SPASM domain